MISIKQKDRGIPEFQGEVQVPFVFKSSAFYHIMPTIEDFFYDAIFGEIHEVVWEDLNEELSDGIRNCKEDLIEILVNLEK